MSDQNLHIEFFALLFDDGFGVWVDGILSKDII
jgi:hypothetical protein